MSKVSEDKLLEIRDRIIKCFVGVDDEARRKSLEAAISLDRLRFNIENSGRIEAEMTLVDNILKEPLIDISYGPLQDTSDLPIGH